MDQDQDDELLLATSEANIRVQEDGWSGDGDGINTGDGINNGTRVEDDQNFCNDNQSGQVDNSLLDQAAAVALAQQREELLDQILFRSSDDSSGDDVSASGEQEEALIEEIGSKERPGRGMRHAEQEEKREETLEEDLGKTEHRSNARQDVDKIRQVGCCSSTNDFSEAVGVGIHEQEAAGLGSLAAAAADDEEDFVVAKAHASASHEAYSEDDILRETPGAIAVCTNSNPPAAEDSLNLQEELEDLELGQPPREVQDALGASYGTTSTATVTAVTVDDDIAAIEQRVRNKILNDAVEASVVESSTLMVTRRRQRQCLAIAVAAALLAIGASIAAGLLSEGGPEDQAMPDGPPMTSVASSRRSTMDTVRERGVLRCGVYEDAIGFSSYSEETGNLEGFNIDQCRAISIAVFGTPDQIEPVVVTTKNRFEMLANRSMDVLTQTVTHTMGRDIFEPSAGAGFTFSTPYFYSGMAFAGIPEMVDCAESLAAGNQTTVEGSCNELKVCVMGVTTHVPRVMELLPYTVPVVITSSMPDAVTKFVHSKCNVFAGEPVSMSESRIFALGYSQAYQVGSHLFSREPLALVTNEDDPNWSALVNTIVNTFFTAEASGMTKSIAQDTMQESSKLDDLLTLQLAIVSELGNYGELYKKHLEVMVPRSGLNNLYHRSENTTGLLYSLPYGDLDSIGPGPTPGKTLDAILHRGYLRCGVQLRPGFAEQINGEWNGFDVDLCRGIAAAIFGVEGLDERVAVHDLGRTDPDLFSYLDTEVDVLAGARVVLNANGISFSPSYFYDSTGDSIAMATSHKDPQWSSFVYWVVMTTFHAEEEGITQEDFGKMPLVNAFGEGFQQMLQNIVHAVGSYQELYDRNLAALLPRGSGNRLNTMNGPQQYPLLLPSSD